MTLDEEGLYGVELGLGQEGEVEQRVGMKGPF